MVVDSVNDSFPCGGAIDDSASNFGKGGSVRFPAPKTYKAVPRLQMDVNARCVNVATCLMTQEDPYVGFEGLLIFGKSGVSIDSHHRSAIWLGLYGDVRCTCSECYFEFATQVYRRCKDHVAVLCFLLGKPLPVVVDLQIRQEIKKVV